MKQDGKACALRGRLPPTHAARAQVLGMYIYARLPVATSPAPTPPAAAAAPHLLVAAPGCRLGIRGLPPQLVQLQTAGPGGEGARGGRVMAMLAGRWRLGEESRPVRLPPCACDFCLLTCASSVFLSLAQAACSALACRASFMASASCRSRSACTGRACVCCVCGGVRVPNRAQAGIHPWCKCPCQSRQTTSN